MFDFCSEIYLRLFLGLLSKLSQLFFSGSSLMDFCQVSGLTVERSVSWWKKHLYSHYHKERKEKYTVKTSMIISENLTQSQHWFVGTKVFLISSAEHFYLATFSQSLSLNTQFPNYFSEGQPLNITYYHLAPSHLPLTISYPPPPIKKKQKNTKKHTHCSPCSCSHSLSLCPSVSLISFISFFFFF